MSPIVITLLVVLILIGVIIMLNLDALSAQVARNTTLTETVIAKLNAPDPGQPAVDDLTLRLTQNNDALEAATAARQPTLPGFTPG